MWRGRAGFEENNVSAIVRQNELPGMPEPANLLEIVSRAASDPNIEVAKVEKLLELYERIQAKNAEAQFNEAMTKAQSEIGRIGADATNPQTRSQYASYAKLDKVLRPIYTNHGFSLSFDEGDSPKPDHVRILCHVARGGYTRTYHKDMPADGKGAKGGDVMTKTHAAGAAMSYGMRYLLKGIFNVAVGEEDRDGNDPPGESLNNEQIANIVALLTESNSDKAKFLKYLKVKSLEEIPAANYSAVIKLLEAKRARA
jgi:hypothetical protein